MPLRAGLASGVATLLVTVTAAPPVLPQARQEPLTFGAEVTLVTVPVFVTDKSGKAVPGLTVADFEVEEQGRKAPVVAFLPVDAMQAAVVPDEVNGRLQAAARRQFLLLFDLTFSTPTGILRARKAASDFVRESLAPTDLAAVATFGQSGVKVLVAFTPDREQVAHAVEELGLVETQPRQRDPLSIAYDLGVRRWGVGFGDAAKEEQDPMTQNLIAMAKLMARGDQAYYRQRVEGFVDGLEQLVRMLDSVQGRKQMVMLSAGFDSSVLGGATGQESQEAAEAVVRGQSWEAKSDRYFGDSKVRDSLDKLFRAVAATDTVIHSVDVSGLAVSGGRAAEVLPQPAGRGKDTLAQFAVNTGGRFIADANDLRAGLDELLEATRYYYVLGFEPQNPGDKPDKPRKLKVRVKGAGLSVSHRRGYVLKPRENEVTPAAGAMRAAESIVKGLSGGAIALSAVAVPYRDARGTLSLPVILQAHGRSLAGDPKAKQLGLELFGYAFDGKGQLRDVVTLSPVVDLGSVKTALDAKGLQFITSFGVPDGTVDLRFLVRDKATQRMGSLRLRVEMPEAEGNAMVLSPPLAMDDPRSRLVLPAPSRGRPALEIPFRLAEAPFTAEPRPSLANGAARDVCVMAWGGNLRFAEDRLPEVAPQLVDASGAAHAVSLDAVRVVPDADGVGRYVLTLRPTNVPPGGYVLRLSVRDPESGATGRSEVAVQVQ
jgi:VWFA-related protein